MKPAGMSPYELRLNLLQLAFNVLSQKHQADACAALRNENANPTTSPTTEEIITEAEKMNKFISTSN